MDVFGDIGDISSESADDNQPPIPGQSVDECGLPQDQQGEKPISETTIEVEIPSISRDLGNELFFVKLPKFLIIEPKPFDPQYYEDEFEKKKVLDQEDRTRLKLKVENTIRWRIRRDEEGNKIKESNARVIKWSDGSLSLHVGSEVFDVYKGPVQGNHLQLFVREDTGLQGQAVFKSKLTFRPHSVGCATHRKMTLPLANRGSGTQKIRILPIAGCDPECQHTEKIKKEHKRVRSSHQRTAVCLQNKQNQQGPRDPSSDEEEEGDEAIENQYHGELGEEQARIYSSDSDEESEENKSQRLPRAKQLSSDEENPPEIGKQGVKRKTMTEA